MGGDRRNDQRKREKKLEFFLLCSLLNPWKDFLNGQVGILIMRQLKASCELITG